MGVQLNPYLSFRDSTREAMTFYQSVFGGELTFSTFGDSGPAMDPAESQKIMHSSLTAGPQLVLFASDTPAAMELTSGTSYAISLSGDDDATLRGYWDKLSDGGTVTMPLEIAPWGDAFGMCLDRFGTSWMVNITGAGAAASAG